MKEMDELKFLSETHNVPEDLIKYVARKMNSEVETYTDEGKVPFYEEALMLILTIKKKLMDNPAVVYRDVAGKTFP